jgi:hypothetical protein
VIAGAWHVIVGIAALVHDNVYVATPQYIYSFDLTARGWVHLLLGRPGDRRRVRGAEGTDVATCGRHRDGLPEHDRQLPVRPSLPRLVATDHRAGRGHRLGLGDVPTTGSLRASRACPAGELFGGQVDPAGCWSLRAGVQRPEGIAITRRDDRSPESAERRMVTKVGLLGTRWRGRRGTPVDRYG